jgi:hypothetical protein
MLPKTEGETNSVSSRTPRRVPAAETSWPAVTQIPSFRILLCAHESFTPRRVFNRMVLVMLIINATPGAIQAAFFQAAFTTSFNPLESIADYAAHAFFAV